MGFHSLEFVCGEFASPEQAMLPTSISVRSVAAITRVFMRFDRVTKYHCFSVRCEAFCRT